MSHSRRVLHAVVRARTQLRDLAAATEARAQSEHTFADGAVSRAHGELDAAIACAGERLAASSSVIELARITDELGAERAAVLDAVAARTAAAAALERAACDLQLRERQRRTVERALDDLHAQRARGDARAEQHLTDDLGGRRRSA